MFITVDRNIELIVNLAQNKAQTVLGVIHLHKFWLNGYAMTYILKQVFPVSYWQIQNQERGHAMVA